VADGHQHGHSYVADERIQWLISDIVNRSHLSKIFIKHQPVRVTGNGLTTRKVANLRRGVPEDQITSDAVVSLLPVPCRNIDLSIEKRPEGTPYAEMQSPLFSDPLDH